MSHAPNCLIKSYSFAANFTQTVANRAAGCLNSKNTLFILAFVMLGVAFEAIRTSLKGKVNKISLAIGATIGLLLSISLLFIHSFLQAKKKGQEELTIKTSSLPKKPVFFITEVPVIPNHEMLKAWISVTICRFLHPYIMGKITPENEPKDRPPLMHQLSASIQASGFPVEEQTIAKLAIKAYAYEAARGMILRARVFALPFHAWSSDAEGFVKTVYQIRELVHEDKETVKEDRIKLEEDLSKTPEFKALADALQNAFVKDFPAQNLSRGEIEKIALQGLFRFIIKNCRSEIEAKNYHTTGFLEDYFKKADLVSKLGPTGPLFLSDEMVAR